MKVAKKSPRKRLSASVTPRRATLTLSMESYRKIEALRGDEPRATWVQRLIESEEARRERAQFAQRLRDEYTPTVCRETLAINGEFPIHDE